jgi:hypothetical protein
MPLAPQAALVLPGWQVPEPSTQPWHVGVTHWLLVHWAVPLQVAQELPPCPQAALVLPGWQAPVPSTQPGQPGLTHWPLVHCWLPLHTWQRPPLAPQAATVLEGVMQVPLGAQQPLRQVELQEPPSDPPSPPWPGTVQTPA